jgi:hypothetical protein
VDDTAPARGIQTAKEAEVMTGHPPGRDRQPVPLGSAALLSSVSARVERLRDALSVVVSLTDAVQGLTKASHTAAARAVAAVGLPVSSSGVGSHLGPSTSSPWTASWSPSRTVGSPRRTHPGSHS